MLLAQFAIDCCASERAIFQLFCMGAFGLLYALVRFAMTRAKKRKSVLSTLVLPNLDLLIILLFVRDFAWTFLLCRLSYLEFFEVSFNLLSLAVILGMLALFVRLSETEYSRVQKAT